MKRDKDGTSLYEHTGTENHLVDEFDCLGAGLNGTSIIFTASP